LSLRERPVAYSLRRAAPCDEEAVVATGDFTVDLTAQRVTHH